MPEDVAGLDGNEEPLLVGLLLSDFLDELCPVSGNLAGEDVLLQGRINVEADFS